MARVPRYIRILIMVVALLWLTAMVAPSVPYGLWLLLPIFYWEVFLFARWLRLRFRWRKVARSAELDDIDREWELWNQ